ncbi:hypothetical protein [Stenomitos frigidus]|uniref:Uncharacterized protein n=1 Tax=Stenomitos frigidus ULC18 TaxID=2107698 RepID=A0A2T1E0Q3_9CYAN|nr:hypothetical protein [Stenomitos frigidus]PSB26204.1 hypothetical protein C7B82_20510 [Stenomitos frigidus ULC18]
MSLVFFEPVSSGMNQDGETDLIRFSEPPQIGATVVIGGERRWIVLDIETYHHDDKAAYLAFIAPEGTVIPERALWSARQMRDSYPAISLDVQVCQNYVISDGLDIDGKPPTGRLYSMEADADDPTRGRRVPSQWRVEAVETYQPSFNGTYTAIHVCQCVSTNLPALALV